VSLAGGIRLNKETLELRIEEVPTLEREPAFLAPVTHDFFSGERSPAVTTVGPFAATPAKGSIVRLRPGAMPANAEAWLGERLEWFQNLKFGFMMHWAPYSQWGCIESWPMVAPAAVGRRGRT